MSKKMEISHPFGLIVRQLREEQALTLREVSGKLGIDPSTLSKIEKNTRKPTKILIHKLANFFQIDFKVLFVAFLSDEIVYQVMLNEEYAIDALKNAQEKVANIKMKGIS